MNTERISISYKSIVFSILFLLGLYSLFLIRDILAGLFIAIMIMAALNPMVNWLEKRQIPRMLAVWIVYLSFIILLVTAFGLIIPPLLAQTITLINNLPFGQLTQYLQGMEFDLQNLEILINQLGSLPRVFGYVSSTVSLLFTALTVIVMTFYLLIERQNLHEHLQWFFGNQSAEEKARQFINQVEKQLSLWIRGELTLMAVIGIMTYVGLLILGISFALPLAIIAGILEILPNIGPTIAAIPAIIVAYSQGSWPLAIFAAVLYIVIQQVENIFVVPQVMKREVGLNQLVTILLLLIGFRLGGVTGAMLAIPIYLVTRVTISQYYQLKANQNNIE